MRACGRPTTSGEGGHTRVCPEGHIHHPRTDPVVIIGGFMSHFFFTIPLALIVKHYDAKNRA